MRLLLHDRLQSMPGTQSYRMQFRQHSRHSCLASRVMVFSCIFAPCTLPNGARPNALQVSGFEHVFEGMDVLVDNMLGEIAKFGGKDYTGLRDCWHSRTEHVQACATCSRS